MKRYLEVIEPSEKVNSFLRKISGLGRVPLADLREKAIKDNDLGENEKSFGCFPFYVADESEARILKSIFDRLRRKVSYFLVDEGVVYFDGGLEGVSFNSRRYVEIPVYFQGVRNALDEIIQSNCDVVPVDVLTIGIRTRFGSCKIGNVNEETALQGLIESRVSGDEKAYYLVSDGKVFLDRRLL